MRVPTTALAEALGERERPPFGAARLIVLRAASHSGEVTAVVVDEFGPEVIGRDLAVSVSLVTDGRDVEPFIVRRTLPGGPAAVATSAAIHAARQRLAVDRSTRDTLAARVRAAGDQRRRRSDQMASRSAAYG